MATINPRNRSAPLDGERNNHGNAAENREKTEAGNMHFSAGDVSRRQQTYLGRAGMKDLRDGRRRKAERSGERREVKRLDKACEMWEEPDGEGWI